MSVRVILTPIIKHILALSTWGQKCIFSDLQPKEISNFDLGHPVDHLLQVKGVSSSHFHTHFLQDLESRSTVSDLKTESLRSS